jgi:hypothetical protein
MSASYQYLLELKCECTTVGIYIGPTRVEARRHAQHAGWLVLRHIVYCPACAKAPRGTGPRCTASLGPRGRCPNPSTAAYLHRSMGRGRVTHSRYARCAEHPLTTGVSVPIWWVQAAETGDT